MLIIEGYNDKQIFGPLLKKQLRLLIGAALKCRVVVKIQRIRNRVRRLELRVRHQP